ncbi:pentatricopeptide repeat-containing protein At1g20230 isoform X1 [Ziziphus jujuba]|uniref:Pentatricopeptide repeat-containing protein At1g20230 isoform X1 n=1 Tax=Ziziphus jujuba TaxID=326968 RepID=A0A6P6GB53_ZIZJJ|nr:pentatricopeptide repeat-containing protein At1g20230 isoform X1 [Ziziphus jujuba]XP_024931391.3 pentatricopeptide repeat-containing protein At1g20230 isoform X1 [Ziziphus jujuba]XP_024931392.3 pentatricopeptide repeat-containing protein At1g20230 isoform X1 [Ziziphus jujuba]XP_024931393.3 pentatricopeptide repeat-containing protein At1g20230 isoform X1 [Ziziphus jujuba]XP_024931394.3 pentatricopeptide repeat-containing protein At1g20230 isoform X1 [Ziziphus jujuba]XP_024931397.3 pentatrico
MTSFHFGGLLFYDLSDMNRCWRIAMTRQALYLLDRFNHSILHFLNSTTVSLSHTRLAHAYILKTGLSNDNHLTTKLLSLYANNFCFLDANLILNSIPNPNLFCFSTLIHAFSKLNNFGHSLRVFSQMLTHGILPDSYLFPSVVKACAGLPSLKAGRQLHGIISVSGFSSDAFVQASLLHMYLKCGHLREAHKLFDGLSQRDMVIWSALIAGYSRFGCVDEAKVLFYEMRNAGLEPNTVSWNGMITGFNHSGLYSEATSMFQKMHLEGFQPDSATISSVLSAIGDLKDFDMGIQVHSYVVKQGLGPDKCIVSALIDMYGKCSCTLEMSEVFNESDQMDVGACNALVTGLSRNGLVDNSMEAFRRFKGQELELNIVSWTSIIACCSQNGKDMDALELFREMQLEGLKPNSITIPCLLPACGNIAALMHGKAAHCFSIRIGISNDVYVGSALIDMYAKCGRIELSQLCFDKMPNRNLVSWNAIMKGYAMHGKAKETMEMFHEMQRSGQKPDLISFTCVLSACSQKGLTDEGWFYFNSMSQEHGIEARLEHYACMVTLLGRAGKLEEAYSMIKRMPFKPDACVWGALLSSCRVHNNVGLGEIAAEHLFKLEPRNPGNYILLSNIYASKSMWNEVDRVRDMMNSMGLRKNPGCSWIEVKNKVHMLLAGDKLHSQRKQIIEKLNKLSVEMKKSGYFPNHNFVLQDVDVQDKDEILCGHSEKLAIAFGLLNTPSGYPLRVIKNLRICGDCHVVIKFISSFEGREISVRDTNRFHHFKDGVCSCEDFW